MGDEGEAENKADIEVHEETKSDEAGEGVSVAGVHVTNAQLPFVGMFFSALILLTAILVGGKDLRNWAYTISVAAVAMFFSLLGFLLTCKADLNEKIGKFNGGFLFLWCFVGACILTFNGPFKDTGNGYFASWALALSSTMAVGVTGKDVKSAITGIGSLLGLGASSIVVICAIIPEIRDDNYRNQGIYALSVACVSLVVVGVFHYMGRGEQSNQPSKAKFAVLAFFAILWFALACIITFDGPFLVTGNGYFGAWAGAILSVLAAVGALKGE